MVDSKKKKKKTESKKDLVDNMYKDDFSDDENFPTEYDRKTAATWVDYVLLNRPLKAIIAMLLVAVILPTLLYGFMYGVMPPDEPFGTCVILPEYWSECMPGRTINRSSECINAKCCWNSTLNLCFHTLPAQHTYIVTDAEEEVVNLSPRQKRTPLKIDSYPLQMRISALSISHAIIQLDTKEPDIPEYTIPIEDSNIETKLKNSEGFWLTMLRRNDSKEILFTTENGPLIASDGFWEISLQFPSDAAVFGAGSAGRGSLRLTSGSAALYSGSQGQTNGRPFLLCLHHSNKSHGVLFESPGALEVVSRVSNLVTIRTTAHNSLNLHVFIGDTPAQVIQELTELTGRHPMLPSWVLGLHVCRDAARNNTLDSVTIFRNESIRLDLPYDSDCVDDSALGVNSLNPEFSRFENLYSDLEMLKSDGRHFIFSLFPHVVNDSVAFNEAFNNDLLLTNEDGETYFGLHRDLPVAYPDYNSNAAAEWLKSQLSSVLEDNIDYDLLPSGLALPDNWPSNEDEGQDDGEFPPIFIPQGLEGSLSNGTVWWRAQHVDGTLHHTRHNEYGAAHARHALTAYQPIFYNTSSEDRLPIFTASKWTKNTPGLWLGIDQPATWDGLKGALLTVLEAGISGEPLAGGGAICGSRGDWSETLCTRWSLLAMAGFPVVRYHHAWEEPPRDPTFMSETSAGIVSRATRLRYQLSPYLYTLMYHASQTGVPIARPMAFEFYTDKNTWTLDEQFMVGPSLMVAPIFQPADVSVKVYFPKPPTSWFHLLDGEPLEITNGTGEITLLSGENEMIMLQRGGHIIIMQEPGNNMANTRDGLMSVYVALECEDELCSARGELYIDDGNTILSPNVTLQFNANATSLTVTEMNPPTTFITTCIDVDIQELSFNISDIAIYGTLPYQIDQVFIDDEILTFGVDFQLDIRRLRISGLNIDWCLGKQIVVHWTYEEPVQSTSTSVSL